MDTGVEENLFKETLLEFVLRTLEVATILEVGEGERLVLGVVKILRVLEEDLDAGSRPRTASLGGESSERSMSRLASDMMSMR